MGAYFSYENTNGTSEHYADGTDNIDNKDKTLRDFEKLGKYIEEMMKDVEISRDNNEDINKDIDIEDIVLPQINYNFEKERKKELIDALAKRGGVLVDSNKIRNLFVRTMTGTIVFHDINPDKYIRNVKNMITEKLLIPVNKYKIKYQSKHLSDYRTLRQYDITDDATIEVHIL